MTGQQAADVLGEPPHLVLKTLMLQVDGRPVCVLVRSDRQVSMKKVAATLGGKTPKMTATDDLAPDGLPGRCRQSVRAET
jgi:Cys-tRNA(Pro)/Cys-tRNA(Cys) deacylase